MQNTSLYHLSVWAKTNPVAARWAILFNRIAMGLAAFYIGIYLTGIQELSLSGAIYFSAFTYLLGYLYYPRRMANRKRPNHYFRQKCCDGFLVLSSCLFWLAVGHALVKWEPAPAMAVQAPLEVLRSAITKSNVKADLGVGQTKVFRNAKQKRNGFFKKLKNRTGRFLKKFRAKTIAKLRAVKLALRQLDAGSIILLIVATLAIGFVMAYATVSFSCTLSCNGQEGAAAFVGVSGLVITIFLIAWMWSAAHKSARRNKQKR